MKFTVTVIMTKTTNQNFTHTTEGYELVQEIRKDLELPNLATDRISESVTNLRHNDNRIMPGFIEEVPTEQRTVQVTDNDLNKIGDLFGSLCQITVKVDGCILKGELQVEKGDNGEVTNVFNRYTINEGLLIQLLQEQCSPTEDGLYEITH